MPDFDFSQYENQGEEEEGDDRSLRWE
jgi:hypothetical protein